MSDFWKIVIVLIGIIALAHYLPPSKDPGMGRFQVVGNGSFTTGYLFDTKTGEAWQLRGNIAYPVDSSITGAHFVPRPEKTFLDR